MKALWIILFVFSSTAARADFDEVSFIKETVSQDIEEFSSNFYSKKIKITDVSTRISLNPLQWLLMLKDLAASEKRKVLVFKYKEEEAPNLKKGFAILTYQKVKPFDSDEEKCFQISINKLEMDVSWIKFSGVFPGLKTLRAIERCVGEDYSF